MHFGPTSLRLTGILAKGLRRPKLRADLKASKQVFAGEVSYVIKIPETDAFSRLSEFDWEVLSLCDGTCTSAEIAAVLNERYPGQDLSVEQVRKFLDGIDSNTWERSRAERNLCILERIRDERKERVNRASLISIYFSAFDPDRVLSRLAPYLGWVFTSQFFIFSLAVFALTTVIVGRDFARFRQEAVAFYTFSDKSGYDFLLVWVMLFMIVGPHEFAHGLACKHFGGEVHQMGFMLLYFSPSFYTDCTDMHLFDTSAKRIWTIMAGIWITLLQACVAFFIWSLSPPGSFISDLSYKFALLAGLGGFLQLNPLLPIDGYYVLSQYLQIDNLRDRSFGYLSAWLKRTILRQKIDLPATAKRERGIFLAYGASATLYSVVLLGFTAGFISNVFTSKFGNWGYLVTAGIIYLLLRNRLRRWSATLRSDWLELKEKFMAWKLTRWQQGLGAAVLLVLVISPTAVKVTTDFLLEPQTRVEVRTPVPGVVQEVDVREGEMVSAGAIMAVLHNSDLEARARVLEEQLKLAESSQRAAQASLDFAADEKYAQAFRRLDAEKLEADRKHDQLVLRAPIAGVVTTPHVEQRLGEYIEEGKPFALLVDRRVMRGRVLVRDRELEDVWEGAQVELKLRSFPFETFSGRVREIVPAVSAIRPVAEPRKIEHPGQELTNFFEVTIEIPNPNGVLQEGMTGTARISGNRYPLAWRMLRAGWRWMHSQIW